MKNTNTTDPIRQLVGDKIYNASIDFANAIDVSNWSEARKQYKTMEKLNWGIK